MGSGAWTSHDWDSYSSTKIAGKTTTNIYTASEMKAAYNPNGVDFRESCDSTEHPNSTPIIIGLDVTGSMSSILKVVASKLGDLVKEVLDRKPVSDPQILFAGIGDAMCDTCPLQITQFESDIRIAEQLTDVYFEQGGGGNGFESYPLAWYFAAHHTKCDNYEKRGKKGFLFTFGDDGYPSKLTKREIKEIFGDTVEADIPIDQVLDEANKQYEIFHFCMAQGGSHREADYKKWQNLLGERAIKVTDYTKIPELIVSILEAMAGKDIDTIVSSWDGSTSVVIKDALSGLSKVIDSNNSLVEF